jgi:hypothetical protein
MKQKKRQYMTSRYNLQLLLPKQTWLSPQLRPYDASAGYVCSLDSHAAEEEAVHDQQISSATAVLKQPQSPYSYDSTTTLLPAT